MVWFIKINGWWLSAHWKHHIYHVYVCSTNVLLILSHYDVVAPRGGWRERRKSKVLNWLSETKKRRGTGRWSDNATAIDLRNTKQLKEHKSFVTRMSWDVLYTERKGFYSTLFWRAPIENLKDEQDHWYLKGSHKGRRPVNKHQQVLNDNRKKKVLLK